MGRASGDFEEKEQVDWVMRGKEASWSPTVSQAFGDLRGSDTASSQRQAGLCDASRLGEL